MVLDDDKEQDDAFIANVRWFRVDFFFKFILDWFNILYLVIQYFFEIIF